MEGSDWFQGTADAVRQSLPYVLSHRPKYILILCADQIYSMNYRTLVAWHMEHHADVTIAAQHISLEETRRLGVIKVDPEMRVLGFKEKPQNPDEIADFRVSESGCETVPPDKPYLGSHGMYLFNIDTLMEALDNPHPDFSRGAIPQIAEKRNMSCFCFDGYWEDVGTIEAFYEANMNWRAGRGIAGVFQLGNSIITHSRQLPPTRIDGTLIADSLVAEGCNIRAESINRCIVGLRTRIDRGCVLEDSILMGNDRYVGEVPYEIGENCRIRHAIIDKNVIIGADTVIENAANVQEADNDLYTIRSGIVVIPGDTVIPPGTRI
jgi:glucose-1-phosphate adenylyltransferase